VLCLLEVACLLTRIIIDYIILPDDNLEAGSLASYSLNDVIIRRLLFFSLSENDFIIMMIMVDLHVRSSQQPH
jgi:hypothetical protein